MIAGFVGEDAIVGFGSEGAIATWKFQYIKRYNQNITLPVNCNDP